VLVAIVNIVGTAERSPSTTITSPASVASLVPVARAMPRSAAASAGASLLPSPIIATRPSDWSRRTVSALASGGTPAKT